MRTGLKNQLLILQKSGEKNDVEVKTVLSTEKEIVGIVVDPKAETADIDTTNNSWPKAETRSEFDSFKAGIKD